MAHWKITLTYDGTPYNGWQIQPTLPTVQGTLAQAIHRVTGETVLPQGSGRTDTGVHALAQVATFSLSVPIPAANLQRALNRALPPSIRILSVQSVPEDFHARHSARRKTYEYRIFPNASHSLLEQREDHEDSEGRKDQKDRQDRICPPMLAPYVWACRFPLELAPLQQAAAHILGTHDFTSFAAVDPDLTTRTTSQQQNTDTNTNTDTKEVSPTPTYATEKSISTNIPTDNTRTIYHSAWRQQDDLLIYRVTSSGFLHHMVRNLVGTFVEVAANRLPPDAIPKILAARNRSSAGPTAPARGLFLVEVEY